MGTLNRRQKVDAVRSAAVPLSGSGTDLDALMGMIGDAQFVLLGEATHGTREFHQTRAQLTRRLIEERGFCAVAVEADWPDACRVNRFVLGGGHDSRAVEALGDFQRFPQWMWRNAEVLEFVSWLREYNRCAPESRKTGFYGLDLYSINRSMAAVTDYLDSVDRDAAQRARQRYGCFEEFGEGQDYGYQPELGIAAECEDEVVKQLEDIRQKSFVYLRRDGMEARDEQFYTEQNARLAQNAQEYYHETYKGGVSSWNLRDRHMAETLAALANHLSIRCDEARLAVWEHNAHLGDARATSMCRRGELNVGQLVRRAFEDDAVLVGFTTYEGAVAAASEWDGPVERKQVRPARDDSYEALFHRTAIPAFSLNLREQEPAEALDPPMRERGIGLIYRPETEFTSHYFEARLPRQFDAVIHIDRTQAIAPLDTTPECEGGAPRAQEGSTWSLKQ